MKPKFSSSPTVQARVCRMAAVQAAKYASSATAAAPAAMDSRFTL